MKESETVELKKSTSELKEALISIASILNKHQKGELYFGVDRDGKVVGQMVTENTLREVSRAISEHIEPKIFPTVNEVVIERKNCVHVEFSGNNVPYYAQGRAHMRVGDEDRQMSAKELERLILQKNQERMKWDKEICKEAKINDISTQKLKWFLEKAGKHFDTVENSLKKLGLLSGERLLNTAVMLFGRNPEKFFPNAKLRCAVFGETKAVTIDMQEYVGDLFTLIEKAEKYILENIHVGMRLEGMYRVDVPEIDKEAFREAVINAFCHRDYYLYDSVNIAIFKNKMEIRSPGLLYGGLTVEKIKTKEVSERRNELLAEMFHQVHFIEKWGRGIGLILSKEPDTNFEEVGRQFVVTFKRKGVSEAVGVSEGVSEGVFEGVNSLLESIRKNPGKRVPQLAKILSIPAKTIERWIKQLKEEGKIEFRGSPKKGGYWVR
ncbi:ATP-dependent DNA helicase [Candidatus Woesearchaeota archaeon CG_4_10_14_0_2_um_filter_33_13]|nr:MAG: ATP-dependent DNA helicase [Candidatus Woesearchaeota archaeon CG_4_10_14_0_2_um_filter_33_13]